MRFLNLTINVNPVLRNKIKFNFLISVQDVPSPYTWTFNGPRALTSIDGNGAYLQQNNNFFELKCTTSKCSWSLMDQKLNVGRDSAVLMYLPPDFECWFHTNKSSFNFLNLMTKSSILLCDLYHCKINTTSGSFSPSKIKSQKRRLIAICSFSWR